jgi:uncharacterized protein
MSELKKKLVVIISENTNGDKATIGFTMANAALGSGMEVAVFLVSDGVELTREGAADMAHVKPFRPLEEMIHSFVENGGTLIACGSCYQNRNLRQEENAPGVRVTGIGELVNWIAAGAATVCL